MLQSRPLEGILPHSHTVLIVRHSSSFRDTRPSWLVSASSEGLTEESVTSSTSYTVYILLLKLHPLWGCGSGIDYWRILFHGIPWKLCACVNSVYQHRYYRLRNQDWKQLTCAHSTNTKLSGPSVLRSVCIVVIVAMKIKLCEALPLIL